MSLTIQVRNGNLEQALRVLKKKSQKNGLLKELKAISEEQLDQDVAVHLVDDDGYYPAHALGVAVDGEQPVLSKDHLVLVSG